MDGKLKTCIRTLGLLLLFLIFSAQAQAALSEKSETDISSAIEVARKDLLDAVQSYESDFQQRIAREDAYFEQSEIPQTNVVAAHLRK